MSNWRSRLTCVAWAAPAAALCALVTRDQQCSLAKVASGSAVAERTYVSRIERGRWASLLEEACCRARACACGHVAAPDLPQTGCLFPPRREVRIVYGGPRPRERSGPPGCFG